MPGEAAVTHFLLVEVQIRIPGHDNLHVRTIWLNVFKGGNVGNLSDQQVYLDQMVAALNDWVGPWAGR